MDIEHVDQNILVLVLRRALRIPDQKAAVRTTLPKPPVLT